MGRRRPNRRAIKKHRSYTTEEAARVLGVAKGSVRRWLKEGLPQLRDRRPYLILGGDLIDFLEQRDKPKHRCQLNELYCFRCQEPREAAGGLIDYVPQNGLSGTISAICSTCETIMHKKFSAANLSQLCRQAEVSFPQGDPRLIETGNPRSNDHFEKERNT